MPPAAAIEICGAREHNLRSIDVSFVPGVINAVSGPSGSGRTSLVIDTVWAEHRYRSEQLAALTGSAPAGKTSPRPLVSRIHNLPPVVLLGSSKGSQSGQTVLEYLGFAKELFALIESRGKRICPRCGEALKRVARSEIASRIIGQCIDKMITIEGIVPLEANSEKRTKEILRQFEKLGYEDVEILEHGILLPIDRLKALPSQEARLTDGIKQAFELGCTEIQVTEVSSSSDSSSAIYSETGICPRCTYRAHLIHFEDFNSALRADEPSELSQEILKIQLAESSLSQILQGSIEAARSTLKAAGASETLLLLLEVLQKFEVSYLPLGRPISKLSKGEWKLLSLAGAIHPQAIGMVYVIDDLSRGLDPEARARVLKLFEELTQRGDTVIIADADPMFASRVPHCVQLGSAGDLISQGSSQSKIVPAPKFKGPPPLSLESAVQISHLNLNNLSDFSASFPLGAFTCVTGPVGSGKSSLVFGALLAQFSKSADHSVISEEDLTAPVTSPLPMVATYSGLFDPLRRFYANLELSRIRGYTAQTFALTSQSKSGRCKSCDGTGASKRDERYRCSACGGGRFERDVLQVRYEGLSMADVLQLRADDFGERFSKLRGIKEAAARLAALSLAHLRIGQPLSRLSSSEIQLLRLSQILDPAAKKRIYLLEEPGGGLTLEEGKRVADLIRAVVRAGSTVIAVEHAADLLSKADFVIELERH